MPDKNGTASYVISQRPASDLDRLLKDLRRSKFTGSLTINFSQGAPSGYLELKQKVHSELSISYLEKLAE